MMDLYQQAWTLLLQRINGKTSWGKNELKSLMLECLVDAGRLVEEATPKPMRDTRPPFPVPVFPRVMHPQPHFVRPDSNNQHFEAKGTLTSDT